jgi:hypothetical protein
MTRHRAAVVLAVLLSPAAAHAQDAQFTVTASSATVHNSPSTAGAVLGKAPRGRVFDVTRDLGSWVKIVWPETESGAAYVHVSMGTLSRRAPRAERLAEAVAPAASSASATAAAPPPAAAQAPLSESLHRTTYIAAPAHSFGLGGRVGMVPEFGVTTRLWSRQRFGMQAEVLRSSETSAVAPGRVTTLEFAPAGIYQFPDRVTDNVWIRPYLGAAAAFRRATLKLTGDTEDPLRHNSVGLRAFGGGELTFPGAPRFAVSADVGYLWAETPFVGFDASGVRFSISGHWYVK